MSAPFNAGRDEVRLRRAAITTWIIGGCLVVGGLTMVWFERAGESVSGSGDLDQTAAQILWSMQVMQLPVLVAGLVALVFPLFLFALRSRRASSSRETSAE
ncbi:MAG TPA: hypothetical protein VG369_01450 [Humibacter sp.]|nr:hypothetical protein [Humibacter sp.]